MRFVRSDRTESAEDHISISCSAGKNPTPPQLPAPVDQNLTASIAPLASSPPLPSAPFNKTSKTLASAAPHFSRGDSGASFLPSSPPFSFSASLGGADMNIKGGGRVPLPPAGAGTAAKVLLFGGAVLYAATNCLYNVEGGHRAIVFNRIQGIKDSVYPEGTHFIIPWFERPTIYDVRARPNLVESTSGSKDLQMVKIGLRVLTRPMPEKLPTIYRTLGENYNERVLPSIIHETLKAVVAQYNASQLITQRETVSREIRKILTERARNFNIALDDVSITSLSFGKEFTHAIEAKQVAAQEAERAKFIVEKAEQDKRSAVIRAQGEAKSAELIGHAIANNPAFLALRHIEAAREISHIIASSANKVFLDSNDLLLNLQQLNVGGNKQKK